MKRKRPQARAQEASKRMRIEDEGPTPRTLPLLRRYYSSVSSLRHYLVSRLCESSKNRARRISRYGQKDSDGSTEADAAVLELLDSVLVGSFDGFAGKDSESFEKELNVFTQQLSDGNTEVGLSQGTLKQAELVDFAVWSLMRKQSITRKYNHILCHGYQRHVGGANNGREPAIVHVHGIPGVLSTTHNKYVQALKGGPWCALNSLLGKHAERVLLETLVHCGLFLPAENSSNVTQLSGVPLSDLKPTKTQATPQVSNVKRVDHPIEKDSKASNATRRGLLDIQFVRHRMLYAKPAITAKGKVHFCLNHLHVLNRQKDPEDLEQTERVTRYMFPRECGLHNVFTSEVSHKDSAQPYMDYTLRDAEIGKVDYRWRKKRGATKIGQHRRGPPLPKRLRGAVLQLVARLRKRHSTCSYPALLQHYCPVSPPNDTTQSLSQASSVAQVSAFCRAAISKVFPRDFWGAGEVRTHNEKVVMRNIDGFVRLRRYESLSLHAVLQDVKVQGVGWLAPDSASPTAKLSQTDFTKRKDLMAELLYYLFDSFIIPLLRGHFHITESGNQRNQLFYFRHDVWRSLAEPALASLKDSMLEECNPASVKAMLARRALGVSRVRLLPKQHGMRPIINLRRRIQKLQHGEYVLGRSINSILTPAFSVLNYEKAAHPEMLGSALFSVEDMYPRLQSFRQRLQQQGLEGKPLYFAKVDVRACFDTVPQKRLMELAQRILGVDTYTITRYARAKLIGRHNQETPGFGAKPSWRYLTKATDGAQDFDFEQEVRNDTAEGRTGSVYVDGVVQRSERRAAILALLKEHVEANLINLGNKFYRQKEGIPQGSVVSSSLCSYFYAELERERLDFIDDAQSILLRLIDDFLVISTRQEVAARFVQTMHQGVPEFGVEVKPEKSLVNFDFEIHGRRVAKVLDGTSFPYCGSSIDTVTLDLSKDKERRKATNIADSITVEYSRLPGQSFYRKTLNALKLQMQAMLLSTSYNSIRTVLSNLHHSFTEVALKSYHYIRSLPAAKQPPGKLVIRAVDDAIKLACTLMRRRKRTSKDVLPYKCAVSNAQARWLACAAFRTVFARRQTKHGALLRWLESQLALPALRGGEWVVVGELAAANGW